jgi:hypothetical protein
MSDKINIMRPGEIRTGAFDFKNFPEITGGDTLTGTPTVTSSPSLTIGGPVVSGTQVQALLSGGVDQTTYLLVATCATAGGKTLVATGALLVQLH